MESNLVAFCTSLVDSLPLPIIICDDQLSIIHTNPPASDLGTDEHFRIRLPPPPTEAYKMVECGSMFDVVKGVITCLPLPCFLCDANSEIALFANRIAWDCVKKKQTSAISVDGSPVVTMEELIKNILNAIPFPVVMCDDEMRDSVFANETARGVIFNKKEDTTTISVSLSGNYSPRGKKEKEKKRTRKGSGSLSPKDKKEKVPKLKFGIKSSKTKTSRPTSPVIYDSEEDAELSSLLLQKSPRMNPNGQQSPAQNMIQEPPSSMIAKPIPLRSAASCMALTGNAASQQSPSAARRSTSFETNKSAFRPITPPIISTPPRSPASLTPPSSNSPIHLSPPQTRRLISLPVDTNSGRSEFIGKQLIGTHKTDLGYEAGYTVKSVVCSGSMHSILLVECFDTEETLIAKTHTINQSTTEDQSDILNSLQYEAEQMAILNHPNIVKLVDVAKPTNLKEQVNRPIWLIMEHCAKGSVGDMLAKLSDGQILPETVIVNILHDVLHAIKYLHSNTKEKQTIIHRDVKAANIFIDSDGTCKLGDFGTIRKTDGTRETLVGTPYCMAPEIFAGQPYTSAVDIWSLGITAIEMADKKPPFTGKSVLEVSLKVRERQTPTLYNPSLWSREFQDLITRMLDQEPRHRWTAERLLDHCIFKSRKLFNPKAVFNYMNKQ
uniref:Serine/threonine protein kinase n=1 Tax=Clandestinovirus TaxID=2831644 RepID=A0A8F8KLI2_9VIRU|nr:serine/threonine protein kinase [Clandestinovirus]